MMKLTDIEVKVEYLQSITAEQAWHYRAIPKEITAESVVFYQDESGDSQHLTNELEFIFGKTVEIVTVKKETIDKALISHYRQIGVDSKLQFLKIGNDNYILQLLNESNLLGSSDIHIERYKKKCRIRFRIDGKLIEKYVLEEKDYPSIVNKVKIRANLDIAEKRLPQDGRISLNHGGQSFDVRVSVVPTLYGEKVVLRLLSKDTTNIDINELGFDEDQLKNYDEGVKKGHGIVLISGPTGSGKTTTLYATLKELNTTQSNILTIEDPIEYTLEGINQVQLKEQIGLTFSSALRAFLRQDPDIIMLGEIRDSETAKMAIRASLTGHLVMSTIHTNTAWGCVSRLVDMGVPSYLLASTLSLAVSQRLVRLLCNHCKKKQEVNKDIYPSSFKPPIELKELYFSKGCPKCHFTGYIGRKAIYEVILIDEFLSKKIKSEEFDIDDYLDQKNIKTLQSNAFELLAGGHTSIDEVYYLLIQN